MVVNRREDLLFKKRDIQSIGNMLEFLRNFEWKRVEVCVRRNNIVHHKASSRNYRL